MDKQILKNFRQYVKGGHYTGVEKHFFCQFKQLHGMFDACGNRVGGHAEFVKGEIGKGGKFVQRRNCDFFYLPLAVKTGQ
ncbi:MAG: hypothetical protein GY860_25885 [Desulfobacteraceae bacterium]|nr:hypothetical protein [Desulfobacteraceae bacterium]